jgi:translation elongation factor EF-Ts
VTHAARAAPRRAAALRHRRGAAKTVGSAIHDAIAKLGENIILQRAMSVVHNPVPHMHMDVGLHIVSYVHGGVASLVLSLPPSISQGRIGGAHKLK